jgi:hypothetical protein
MAKPLKRSNKLAAKCSGLSSSKKAPIMSARVADKRMSSTSADGGDATLASKHVLNLLDSKSLTSEDEAAPPERPRKCLRESPLSKAILKPSVLKGIFG